MRRPRYQGTGRSWKAPSFSLGPSQVLISPPRELEAIRHGTGLGRRQEGAAREAGPGVLVLCRGPTHGPAAVHGGPLRGRGHARGRGAYIGAGVMQGPEAVLDTDTGALQGVGRILGKASETGPKMCRTSLGVPQVLPRPSAHTGKQVLLKEGTCCSPRARELATPTGSWATYLPNGITQTQMPCEAGRLRGAKWKILRLPCLKTKTRFAARM